MACGRAAIIVLGNVCLLLLLAVPPPPSPPLSPSPTPSPPPSPPPPPPWRLGLTGAERRQVPRAVRDLRRPHGWARAARRRGRLYCQVGIGFHLQLRPSGQISGTHTANSFSVLEIFSVARGVVGIWGVSSRRYLAMNRKGKLYATSSFTDDCLFLERFQENGYNTYASARHGAANGAPAAWLVALNKLGRARRGASPRVRLQHVSTHFLPRLRRVAAARDRAFRVVGSTPGRGQAPAGQPRPRETQAGAGGRPEPQARAHSARAEPGAVGGHRAKEARKYLPRFRFG